MAETTIDLGSGGFRTGKVIATSFTVFREHVVPFSFVLGIVWLPIVVLTYLGEQAAEDSQSLYFLPALLLTMIIYPISSGIVVYGTFQSMRGKPFTMMESVQYGLRRFPTLLGVSILSSLAISAGMLLLIIPGIMLATAWYAAAPVCVVERLSSTNSLSRSAALTKGYRWPVFGIMFLSTLAVSIVDELFKVGGQAAIGPVGSLITMAVWGGISQALLSVLSVVVYHDLRVAKEGVDIERIASVFE